jgi:HSP20 family molecular chaperone IbpA
MQQIIHLLFAGILLTSVLPVTAWGYGAYDYYADRSRFPSAGSAEGYYRSGSLRLQTGATAEGYYVRAYLEGLTPEDVQVYVRHNRLYLRVAQGERRGTQTGNTRNSSQWQMHYSRQLRLPYDADWMQMRTTTKNGVMEIYMPRRGRYAPVDPSLN